MHAWGQIAKNSDWGAYNGEPRKMEQEEEASKGISQNCEWVWAPGRAGDQEGGMLALQRLLPPRVKN